MGDHDDVSIEVDMRVDMNRLQREEEEERNSRRIEKLKTRSTPGADHAASSSEISPSNPQLVEQTTPSGNENVVSEDHEAKNNMDLTLYRAAKQAHVGEFISVIEHIVNEEGLALSAVFDQISPIGNTYLHIAASCNNDEIVTLIAHHIPSLIIKKNFNGDTALHLAARAGFLNTVNALLRFRKDIVGLPSVEMENEQEYFSLRIRNEKGNTALHEALMNSREDIASRLIKEDIKGAFYLNNELESPLSLAAKAGYQECICLIFSLPQELAKMIEMVKAGKSPVHAAITSGNRDVLELMVSKAPELLRFTDEKGRFPLHYAASMGYLKEVDYLLLDNVAANAIKRDKNGLLPIHWASRKGKVAVIKKLLQHSPHPVELLDLNGSSILHLAAKSGRYEVVGYILKDPTLEGLINMKDKQGDTPMHLAAMHCHPKIVRALTCDSRVNLKIVNDEGMTGLDVATHNIENASTFRQRLTCQALKDGGVPRARPRKFLNVDRQTTSQMKTIKSKYYKDRVNTLLLVSTLVATITFAAGFTIPGGYNNSDPYQGLAAMLEHRKFHVFIFCDMIAMYSSMLVTVTLIWAQLDDPVVVLAAMKLALPLLGIALAMMFIAFMAGISVVVSKLKWLDNAIWIMGATFLFYLGYFFVPLSTPLSLNLVLRYDSLAMMINYIRDDLEVDQEATLMVDEFKNLPSLTDLPVFNILNICKKSLGLTKGVNS